MIGRMPLFTSESPTSLHSPSIRAKERFLAGAEPSFTLTKSVLGCSTAVRQHLSEGSMCSLALEYA